MLYYLFKFIARGATLFHPTPAPSSPTPGSGWQRLTAWVGIARKPLLKQSKLSLTFSACSGISMDRLQLLETRLGTPARLLWCSHCERDVNMLPPRGAESLL